jgi:hypothetical protein
MTTKPKTASRTSPRVPDWTTTQIGVVRKMIRQGASDEAIAQRLGPDHTAKLVDGRARRLGLPRPSRRAHQGTTTLSIRAGDKVGDAADLP